jgi:hypothetical protein
LACLTVDPYCLIGKDNSSLDLVVCIVPKGVGYM